jgi:hypothetical protein
MSHNCRFVGKTVESNNAYVGLHEAKIGHSEAHKIISHNTHSFDGDAQPKRGSII